MFIGPWGERPATPVYVYSRDDEKDPDWIPGLRNRATTSGRTKRGRVHGRNPIGRGRAKPAARSAQIPADPLAGLHLLANLACRAAPLQAAADASVSMQKRESANATAQTLLEQAEAATREGSAPGRRSELRFRGSVLSALKSRDVSPAMQRRLATAFVKLRLRDQTPQAQRAPHAAELHVYLRDPLLGLSARFAVAEQMLKAAAGEETTWPGFAERAAHLVADSANLLMHPTARPYERLRLAQSILFFAVHNRTVDLGAMLPHVTKILASHLADEELPIGVRLVAAEHALHAYRVGIACLDDAAARQLAQTLGACGACGDLTPQRRITAMVAALHLTGAVNVPLHSAAGSSVVQNALHYIQDESMPFEERNRAMQALQSLARIQAVDVLLNTHAPVNRAAAVSTHHLTGVANAAALEAILAADAAARRALA